MNVESYQAFTKRYKNNHPSLIVKCDSTEEFNNLQNKVYQLFSRMPNVEYSVNVKQSCMILDLIYSEDDTTLDRVQNAKDSLFEYITIYNSSSSFKLTIFLMTMATMIATYLAAFTIKSLWILSQHLALKLEKRNNPTLVGLSLEEVQEKELGPDGKIVFAIFSAISLILTGLVWGGSELAAPPSRQSVSTLSDSRSSPTSSSSQQQALSPDSTASNSNQLPPAQTQEIGWIRLGAVQSTSGSTSVGDQLIETSQPVTISPPYVPEINDEVTITNGVNLRSNYPQPPNYQLADKLEALEANQKVLILETQAFVDTSSSVKNTIVWARLGIPSADRLTNQDLSTAVSTPSGSLSEEDAVNLISQWLQSKQQIFAAPFDKSLAENFTTGQLYQDLTKSDGAINWLRSENAYYRFDRQKLGRVDSFNINGSQATLRVEVTEGRTLYINGKINNNETGFDTRLMEYKMMQVDQLWKISDYEAVQILTD